MISNELLQAYLNTTYQLDYFNIKIRIGHIDEHLERMLDEWKVDEWAFITAYNPGSEIFQEEENIKRHEALHRDVTAFVCFEGEGIGEDPSWKPERSLLILGLQRESAMELGVKYGQNAIVVGRRGKPAELMLLK
jgi:hypothetical protein